jgi:O-antigen biosynthesis protein WbqP
LYEHFLKRVFDVIVASVVCVVLLPVFIVVAVLIRMEDGGPAIFKQQRSGRGGRPFTLYKFRSMPVSSPSVPSSSAQTLTVTRIGRVIRRTNIDELPQLWNVIRGDMTLVGPRPALLSQTSLLGMRAAAGIDRVRPGLTGLAQVNAYDGMPESEKLRWEEQYARRIRLVGDLLIVARTFRYLTRRPPVY